MPGPSYKAANRYSVVFNFVAVTGTDIYLPHPVICENGQNGLPAYQKAAAYPENFTSYFPDPDPIVMQLVQLSWALSVPELEKSLNKGKKKPLSLHAWLENKDTNKTVLSILNKRSALFYDLVLQTKAPLCIDLERKTKAHEVIVSYARDFLVPKLRFTRTQTGIKYEMALMSEEGEISIFGRDVIVLQDDPGILVIDNTLYRLSDINAGKLKPFIKNEYVFIPDKLVRDYFNKFIADIVGKAETEAIGFNLERHDTPEQIRLSFVYDIFENRWVGIIEYLYSDVCLKSIDKSKRKVRISFSENNVPFVNEFSLNDQVESTAISKLLSFGFEYANGRTLYGSGEFEMLYKVTDCITGLQKYFEIEPPEIGGKQVQFTKILAEPDFNRTNDWFDLSGKVRIGEDEYPISKLFANIRNDDPYFITSEGRCVLIPVEIMSKYSSICRFAKDDGPTWRLPKMHFILINEEHDKARPESTDHTEPKTDYLPSPGLKTTLRPYQWDGVRWLLRHRDSGLGACLADDMGLGKTLQTLAVLLDTKDRIPDDEASMPASGTQLDLFGAINGFRRKALKALIVLPASLIFNWQLELKRFAPSLQVISYTGPMRDRLHRTLSSFDVILTTYQTAVSDHAILDGIQFSYIILDESQQIRNRDTKVFKTLHQLKADNRLTLSGTPMENSLSDLWSQMEFINPSILGTYAFFRDTYQIPVEKNKDQDAIRELRTLVSPYILRRTKEEVARDLPELTQDIHFSEMSEAQAKAYETERSSARNALLGLDRSSSGFRFHVLASILRLRQIANHPVLSNSDYSSDSGKFDDITSQISTIVKSGHKLLIFSSFLKHLNIISSWLEKNEVSYVSLTGQMSSDERQKSVTSFQQDGGVQVFLLSIKAGGTGLNLTQADYIFILEPWWNPFVEKQAVARAHRIGRKKPVIVKRFITKDSIEEKILNLQKSKVEISGQIIESDDPVFLDNTDLEQLLE